MNKLYLFQRDDELVDFEEYARAIVVAESIEESISIVHKELGINGFKGIIPSLIGIPIETLEKGILISDYYLIEKGKIILKKNSLNTILEVDCRSLSN